MSDLRTVLVASVTSATVSSLIAGSIVLAARPAASSLPAAPAQSQIPEVPPNLRCGDITEILPVSQTTGGSVWVMTLHSRSGIDLHVVEATNRADAQDRLARVRRAIEENRTGNVAITLTGAKKNDTMFTGAGNRPGWAVFVDGVQIGSWTAGPAAAPVIAPPQVQIPATPPKLRCSDITEILPVVQTTGGSVWVMTLHTRSGIDLHIVEATSRKDAEDRLARLRRSLEENKTGNAEIVLTGAKKNDGMDTTAGNRPGWAVFVDGVKLEAPKK